MKRWVLLLMMLVLLVMAGNFGMAATDFNYADVSAKSILYYEASWCGPDAGTNRLNWRGPCHTDDGKDVGVDLTGGFHDAGDHVKFGLPQGYAGSVLAWTLYEYKDTLVSKGQYDYLYKVSKNFTDYFIKCHPNANTFYYQIGEGNNDHAYWGPPELQPLGRQTYAAATPSTPASEMCGEAAAALALMSLNTSDTTYKSKCLSTAQSIYNLGKTYIGRGTGQSFYQSGPVYDELAWAAVWLYYATNNSQYLTDADNFIKAHLGANGANGYVNRWTMCWDDVWAAVFIKLYQATGAQVYKDCIEANLSFWMSGITTTPGGLKYLDSWGVLRYTAAECAIALLYSEISGNTTYRDFAKTQIDYILGNNPRSSSYVVGCGTNYPKFPHHRAASGRLEGPPADEKKIQPEKHILYGALVGGPKSDDSYVDDIDQYVYTEVACDYNAGFVNAMAGMTKYYGASQTVQPIPQEPEVREFYVDALVMGESGSEIKLQTFIHNESIHPPHYDTGLSYRYFLDLSEMYSKGYTISNVTVGTYNNPNNATISALTPCNEANRIYYVEVSWAGKNIFGKSEIQLVFTSYSTGALVSSNDYSRTGLTTTLAVTDYIPVYRNGVKIYGNEPPRSGTPTPTFRSVTATPTPTIRIVTSTPTPTVRTATPTPTRRVTPTPTRREATSTPTRRGVTPTPTRRVTPTPTVRTATPTPTRPSSTPTPTQGTGGYVVTYAIQSDWGTGATINVTIKNNTTTAVNGWTLAFTFPGNQTIANLWNGTYTQSGASVSVRDAGSNANIPANGGSVNFGFNINYSGTNAKPTSFTLNGTACQAQ